MTVDRMAVIAREECPTHGLNYGNPPIREDDTRQCQRQRCRKTLVRVEYVPVSQLAGAVEDLREVELLLRNSLGINGQSARVNVKVALKKVRALVAAGGQSSSPASDELQVPEGNDG